MVSGIRFGWLLPLACLLVAVGGQPLAAQVWEDYDYENLEFRGIGFELGLVRPVQVESTVSLALRGDLGYLGPNIRIVPSIGFWSSNLRQREVDRLSDQIYGICLRQTVPPATCPEFDLGRIRLSDLMLNLDVHYEFAFPAPIIPYAGAGAGVHLLNSRGEFINDTFIEELFDGITPGINLMGGVRIPLGDLLHLTGEARYVIVSDVRHAALAIGGVWMFARPLTVPGQPWGSRRAAR